MSKKHRGELHEEHTDETWLIPYADLLTLLLALFVILYASSNVDMQKLQEMQDAWVNEMNNGGGLSSFMVVRTTPADETAPDESDEPMSEDQSLEELEAILKQMLADQGLQDQVNTSIDDRGLVISMNDAVLFDPGYAVIKDQYRDILVRIGETIDRLPNYIRVEGHTDDVPQSSEQFPSNWELSTGRATSVVRLFADYAEIAPEKLMAVGYGEWRPISDNLTPEGRSKNRRVDVIILSSRYNILENQGMRNRYERKALPGALI
jgi:chemotaxis protein MotB